MDSEALPTLITGHKAIDLLLESLHLALEIIETIKDRGRKAKSDRSERP